MMVNGMILPSIKGCIQNLPSGVPFEAAPAFAEPAAPWWSRWLGGWKILILAWLILDTLHSSFC